MQFPKPSFISGVSADSTSKMKDERTATRCRLDSLGIQNRALVQCHTLAVEIGVRASTEDPNPIPTVSKCAHQVSAEEARPPGDKNLRVSQPAPRMSVAVGR